MSKAQILDTPSTRPLAETLAGQTALITGASSGIGRAIAVELAARGASLCLLGRRPVALEEIAFRLAPGARRGVYRTDLADREGIEKLTESLARDGAKPTILVHSAGVIALGPLEQASLADFDRQLNVNVRAPYVLTQALLGGLKARRGQIVFINSSAGVSAVPGSGQYSATKHALRALADSLRAEVNGQVRVTSVFTGATATPMQRALHAAKGRAYAPESLIQAEDVAAVVGHVLSLPRSVELTDIHMRPAQPPA
jgi:NADP-dependent 3-hydroxy acid dehydrogenase YdfG